ncbi:MAG: HAD-IIB family hydrolase [Verrucomicrobiota bacterium]|jgi:hypothetical protein|nr:HAD-IIB family hydrolase [Verrucomicrobiota bacterium]
MPATPQLQLICTDFDGTLHSDFTEPAVPIALQEKLRELQANGVKWIINTGRTLEDLQYGLDKSDLSVYPDYVVVVERDIYRYEGDEFIPHNEWNERCAAAQAALFAHIADRLPEIFEWVNLHFTANVYEDKWSPFCLIAGNNPDADEIQEYVEKKFADEPLLSFVRNDVYARLSHTEYTKGTALKEITRLLNIPCDGVLAAGDHWNDVSMLQPDCAQWIVAPANAIPEVAQHVRSINGFIAQSNCGLGVIEGLEWALNDI